MEDVKQLHLHVLMLKDPPFRHGKTEHTLVDAGFVVKRLSQNIPIRVILELSNSIIEKKLKKFETCKRSQAVASTKVYIERSSV